MANFSVDKITEQVAQFDDTLPPIHLWHPACLGDMDLIIKADGTWHHEGRRIEREALIRLFSRILRREEDGEYYLVTPVEKFRIQVEDAPFHAVIMDVTENDGQQELVFHTQQGDRVRADSEHPIRVVHAGDEPRPYVRVRDALDALISRNLFYQMVEIAQQRSEGSTLKLGVESAGVWFELGEL